MATLAWCGTAGRFAPLALCKHGHGSVPNGPHQSLHQESRVGEAQKSPKKSSPTIQSRPKTNNNNFTNPDITLNISYFNSHFLLIVAIFAGGDAREEV